jgi:hypothetical protein
MSLSLTTSLNKPHCFFCTLTPLSHSNIPRLHIPDNKIKDEKPFITILHMKYRNTHLKHIFAFNVNYACPARESSCKTASNKYKLFNTDDGKQSA